MTISISYPGLLEQLFSQGGGGQQPAGNQPMSLASLGQGGVQRAPLPPVQDDASQRVSQAHGDMCGNVFSRFMKTVQAGGVTNPAALAAIASTGKHESGFSEKNAAGTWSDPSQSGRQAILPISPAARVPSPVDLRTRQHSVLRMKQLLVS